MTTNMRLLYHHLTIKSTPSAVRSLPGGWAATANGVGSGQGGKHITNRYYIYFFFEPHPAPLCHARTTKFDVSSYHPYPGLLRECGGTDCTIRSYYWKNLDDIPDAAVSLVCADKQK
ncbi:MAG: hypothetical protein LLG93_15480 [Deltaproteobacteria bacterium]|nr:hypothetical protein [Deltaproteobacteria bacterium]